MNWRDIDDGEGDALGMCCLMAIMLVVIWLTQ
jgi:hypothetical protein